MFDNFRKTEVAISKQKESHLVKPSGILESNLIVRMHYPDFDQYYYYFDFLSAGDVYNVSMNQLMNKLGIWGTEPNNQVLFQDLYCRLSRKEDHKDNTPMQSADKNVLEAHLEFADQVWSASSARFGLLCGAHVMDISCRTSSWILTSYAGPNRSLHFC